MPPLASLPHGTVPRLQSACYRGADIDVDIACNPHPCSIAIKQSGLCAPDRPRRHAPCYCTPRLLYGACCRISWFALPSPIIPSVAVTPPRLVLPTSVSGSPRFPCNATTVRRLTTALRMRSLQRLNPFSAPAVFALHLYQPALGTLDLKTHRAPCRHLCPCLAPLSSPAFVYCGPAFPPVAPLPRSRCPRLLLQLQTGDRIQWMAMIPLGRSSHPLPPRLVAHSGNDTVRLKLTSLTPRQPTTPHGCLQVLVVVVRHQPGT